MGRQLKQEQGRWPVGLIWAAVGAGLWLAVSCIASVVIGRWLRGLHPGLWDELPYTADLEGEDSLSG